MGLEHHEETERKFDVGPETVFPALNDVEGVGAVSQPADLELEAVYFDTHDLDLARNGVTLRRRTGGDDAGWHLKLPKARDTRTELRLPLGRATKTVPKGILPSVRAIVRDRELVPIARVRTHRRAYTLLAEDSLVLVEVCDDEVLAERLPGPDGAGQTWREWEIELVDGDPGILEAIAERLLAVGATRASVSSKLDRILGDAVPPARPKPSTKGLARGSAGEVVHAQLAVLTDRLHKQDARLRAEQPGSIHKLRIAARRIRSALKTYKPLLAPGSAEAVAEELRWLGQTLAEARDAQVLRERLRLLVASEPPELVLGPVLNRIEEELRTAYRSGLEQALRALDSERYFRLLDALDQLVASMPLKPKADAPARKVLPRLLKRDGRRLRRAVAQIGHPEDPGQHDPGQHDPAQHDADLHEVRKKAKRFRYAAESARPVLGARAKALAVAAKQVQQALGEHQDSVIARRRLREYGAKAHIDGENGFSFGRMHALEQHHADEQEREFNAAWEALRHKKRHRWTWT